MGVWRKFPKKKHGKLMFFPTNSLQIIHNIPERNHLNPPHWLGLVLHGSSFVLYKNWSQPQRWRVSATAGRRGLAQRTLLIYGMIGQVDSFLLGDGLHLYSYFLRWIWRTNFEHFLGVGDQLGWMPHDYWIFGLFGHELSSIIAPNLTSQTSSNLF